MTDDDRAASYSSSPAAAQPPAPPEGAQRPAPPEAAQRLTPPEAKPAPPSFSEWLRAEMDRRAWRQADVARATGIDVSMISRWLSGRRPDTASLERVAVALGVDLDTLLTLTGHRAPSLRDDDPLVATLIAKVRHVNWTPERFLIVDALLDDLRRRSPHVPVEQASLPGLERQDAGA